MPKDDPMAVPMLFLNTGWMTAYQGLASGDTIHGGGTFVWEQGFGHEMFNFQKSNGRVYGYAHSTGIKLERIGGNKTDDKIDGVLVVWLATHPMGGSFVVGWYRNATIYRKCQPAPPASSRTYDGKEFEYFVTVAASDATLLAPDDRTYPIKRQVKGWLGQYNVWYADNPREHRELRRNILKYVKTRRPPRGAKQARQPDPVLRCRVEEAAMTVTVNYYSALGYAVDRRDKDNLGWDLDATLGKRELQLEVKGLSGSVTCVELTPNEYAQMQRLRHTYRICIVTDTLTNPRLAVFAFNAESGQWEDGDGRPLRIQEKVAARCSVD